MGTVGCDAVDSAQPDGWVTGHQYDQGGAELLRRARPGQRPDPERLEDSVRRRFEVRQERELVVTHRADDRRCRCVAFHAATVDERAAGSSGYGQAPKGSISA